ncbi:hypothetical protein COLO4_32323 [Corchorus olitorius]|uniref:Uncharacterized protein n=1 Tax=Corchorus olitorius TaxID=93759 RepID=A0A1R3GZM9_9ROSI|nr:hypothetical protein COLO4_32323 [Corchorus olitorius]
MSRRSLFASYKLQSLFESILHPYKSRSGNMISPGNNKQYSMVKRYDHHPMNQQGLRFLSFNMGIWRKLDSNIAKDVGQNSSPPAGSGPPKFGFPVWARWVLGSVLSLIFPFWKDQWANFKTIEEEAEMIVEEVETVAEVVEKVATVAEKVSAQVAENLPDDSKLKKAAMVVEHVSEITAQDAHATTEFIHQVEAIKEDLDGLESLVEPEAKMGKKEGQGK